MCLPYLRMYSDPMELSLGRFGRIEGDCMKRSTLIATETPEGIQKPDELHSELLNWGIYRGLV